MTSQGIGGTSFKFSSCCSWTLRLENPRLKSSVKSLRCVRALICASDLQLFSGIRHLDTQISSKTQAHERNDVFEGFKVCGIPLDVCFKASSAGLKGVRIKDGTMFCST